MPNIFNNLTIKVCFLFIAILYGCNSNLKKNFMLRYEKREIFDNFLNCHSYFIKTIDLGDSYTTPYEYYVFFKDGTLFYDVGVRKNYINSTIFSIDSINSKKNNLYNWGYYNLHKDTLNIYLPEQRYIRAFLTADTLYVFDGFPGSYQDSSWQKKENVSNSTIFIKKDNLDKIDSTNILMQNRK